MKKLLNKKVIGALIALILAILGSFGLEFNLDDGTQASLVDIIVSLGE